MRNIKTIYSTALHMIALIAVLGHVALYHGYSYSVPVSEQQHAAVSDDAIQAWLDAEEKKISKRKTK